MDTNATIRFSDRVDNYAKFRPTYPIEVIKALKELVGLSCSSIVADIGSGTGLFSQVLLKYGCQVCAVEPNAGMRESAEKLLGSNTNFKSIDGSAENTSLKRYLNLKYW